MVNFKFTEEQEAFRQEIINFIKVELSGKTNTATVRSSFVPKLVEKGWLGLTIPEEYGGLGRDAVYLTIFNEEMAYHQAPISLSLYGRSNSVFGKICLQHGSQEQRQKWLPRLAQGEAFGQCFTEPEAGTDMTRIQTRAVLQGDHYIVNGQKMFITTTHILRYTLLMARTNINAPAESGLSMFIMDNKSTGITFTPLMGMGGYRTNQLFLDNVEVPSENLIGEENRGYEYYLENKPFYLNKEKGAEVGALRRSFEQLVKYAKETTRDGHLLANNPIVRQRLAEMATNIRTMRHLTYRMAFMEAQGLDLFYIASIARVFIVETWLKFNSTALQLLGLNGQLQRGAHYAPLGGSINWHYEYDALQYFTRGSPSYTKSYIAMHDLGLPEN